jgi:hypothetical protein
MLNIDQFVYTSASLSWKSGYQIIAKSNGVTEEIVSALDPYLYPIGITPSKFKESKSLLVLKKNKKIAFSKIRNIGIGYDGRGNTLYNHTLVMDLEDFRQIDFDTRILEHFYFEDFNIQGNLPRLKIEPRKSTLQIDEIEDIELVLREILSALFNEEKIAIIGSENTELIQKILGLMPPSMRLISFSTLVNDVDKQPNYNFISISNSKLSKGYHVINIKFPQSYVLKEKTFEDGIDFLTEMILSKNSRKIQEFHDRFESLPHDDYKAKLVLLTHLSKLDSNDKDMQQEASYVILSYLEKFDVIQANKIFNEIKQYVRHEDVVRYAPSFEIPSILNKFENSPIEKETIEKMLNMLRNHATESRMQLLHEFFQKHNDEFIKNGTQILIDSRYSYYRFEIYRLFVENENLHDSIFAIFDPNYNLDTYYKKGIYETIFNLSSKINPELIAPLLDYKIFDLSKWGEDSDFKNLIKEFFSSSVITKLDFNLLLIIINKICLNIQNAFEIEKNSWKEPFTKSTNKRLIEIAKVVKVAIETLIQNHDFSITQKNSLILSTNEITRIIERDNVEYESSRR